MAEQARELSIAEALDLGRDFAIAGNHEQACGWFRGVLKHEPESFEAMLRLGCSLFELKKHHEALYWFWRTRKLNRRHPLALTNYGLTLAQLGHHEESLPDLERAVTFLDKDVGFSDEVKALAYNNLGNTLIRLDRHAEALAALNKGIAYVPTDPFPHYNRGIALLRLNRQREAIAALDRSIELRDPVADTVSRLNAADAYYNRGMARLLLGDLGGFTDYEYRLQTSENTCPDLGLNPAKRWTNSPPTSIAGKRLLVHCEQGLGDTIQFLRFVPPLIARGAKVLVICHAESRVLFEQIDGVEIPEVGQDFEYDAWIPLMSLALALHVTSEADLPPPWVPSINAVGNRAIDLNGWSSSGLKVGVCWAGNWQHKNDRHRSIPLDEFAVLFDTPCVDFVSLQQMRAEDTHHPALKRPNVRCLWLDDWCDTTAVIRNLDLVITADTAVAHLAASIGVPTWILIPAYGTDWRWQLERTDSPWYPAARLYRQWKIGHWPSVISMVRKDLADTASAGLAA